jgi:hypothetical protein
MKKLITKFGKLITASFFIMGIGIILFLLSIPLYSNFGIDTDIIGLIVFAIGLAICVMGIIIRYKPHGWRLIGLVIAIVILLIPLVQLVISLVNFLITGKPMGG